ncbi:MAG: globin [Actinomycetales bacterium]|nr:globin [Actinomycetales bacterium]
MFGGGAFFTSLVHAFYERVAEDPILRPMYPPGDLAPAERRLRMFLEQYWGGPTTYDAERGHPRLRMRHASYPIDSVARDRWLSLMHEALAEQALAQEAERVLWQYLVSAAFAMQNIPDEMPASALPMTED